ncbi:hypothetical protein MFIFM68171_02728 [Madurella fahalii]|uniref:chitinase n=1 Tax=Madurella fahalii TaxID=1157608 RepID=A0ABQ0G426_9PEZI
MWLPRLLQSPAIALLAWSTIVRNVAAQVSTPCFPMNKTCPPDPAFGMDVNFHFNQTPRVEAWETTVGPVTYDVNDGALFRITNMGDSPTIRTRFYFFWGRTEIWLKAARGTGVISSVMFLSDNLDEIDWEFFGSNETVAQSNFFGKGINDHSGAGYHTVPGGVQDDYHNYTTYWTKDALDFYIDGNKVRTLLPRDANNSYTYPQTPMRLSIGIWAGGDPRMPPGTREWAGGDTDYSQGPFDMWVRSAHVTDFSSGREYVYSDRSGSWESIRIVEGNSTIKEVLNAPPEKTLAEKWNELPNGAKIAVYASAAGVGAALIAVGLLYCIRQRRRGAREARAAEARAEAERLELERFKKAGVDPDSFVTNATEYNAKDMRDNSLGDNNSYSVPASPVVAASPLGEKWDSASAAMAAGMAGGMRSPMPLLHDGAQSPRVASPGPGSGMYSDRAANTRSPAPSMVSPTQQYAQQSAHRSFTSPNPQMRMGSPAPSQHDFGAMNRAASPAQLAHPQPQRSFTSDGYSGQDAGHGGQDAGYRNGGSQDYWGNGGGYR